jgi:hypothetical protein
MNEGTQTVVFLLIRGAGKLKERMEAAKGAKGCTVEPHELLYPIPQAEIDVSNNMLIQNPGY